MKLRSLLIWVTFIPALILLSFIMILQQVMALQLGTIIHVPGDQPTIQAAINVAMNGDIVLVSPGTYQENLNFLGKAITVTSEAGPQVTIIDGAQIDSVVKFVSGEGAMSVLKGFTIQNGNAGEGGGITIQNSSPTIIDNLVTNNQAAAGGGIGVGFGSPIIKGNTISNNTRSSGSGGIGGGGISIRGNSAAQILRNTIINNFWVSGDGGGISLFAAGTPIISNNVISGNTTLGEGGGISMVNFSDALISQNLIISNSAATGGGIYWLVPSGNRGPLLVNNTIADNNSLQGSGIFADGFEAQTELINNMVVGKPGQTAVYCGNFNDTNPPIFQFNDIFNSAGSTYGGICTDQTGTNGNISEDPLFLSPGAGDYNLQLSSPVIDAGDNVNCPSTDIRDVSRPQGGICDMGAYEIVQIHLPLILR
jgi:hypothetical protein